MRPAARVAAAIGILDDVIAGSPAEKALTNWARGSRYAGSGDRAAVRDHVFGALRCRRSFAHLGGAQTGRGLMLGWCRAQGVDPAEIFTGEGHAPDPLTPDDAGADDTVPEAAVRLDLPDWLLPRMRASLGEDLASVAELLRQRAPVFLRVNTRKASVETVIEALAADEIEAVPHPLSPTALEVGRNARRVTNSAAYRDGWIELQDAGSQAICDMIPLSGAARVLDYCAGGGGKTLSLAARHDAAFVAHDASPQRMKDLPARAARAGVSVRLTESAELPGLAPFDVVLCDVPCSGSGAWRRSPEGKWALTAARLDELRATQAEILDAAAERVGPGGALIYATCSILDEENMDQIQSFMNRSSDWTLSEARRILPGDGEGGGSDGFFVAVLTR